MELKNLTEAEWHRLKKAAGIKSAGFFKKHDAAVGKYVKAFQAARTKWKSNKGLNNLLELNTALDNLKTAIVNFLAKKEFKTEVAQDLQQELNAWKIEIETKSLKLAKKLKEEEPELRSKDVEFASAVTKTWGMGGLLDD